MNEKSINNYHLCSLLIIFWSHTYQREHCTVEDLHLLQYVIVIKRKERQRQGNSSKSTSYSDLKHGWNQTLTFLNYSKNYQDIMEVSEESVLARSTLICSCFGGSGGNVLCLSINNGRHHLSIDNLLDDGLHPPLNVWFGLWRGGEQTYCITWFKVKGA